MVLFYIDSTSCLGSGGSEDITLDKLCVYVLVCKFPANSYKSEIGSALCYNHNGSPSVQILTNDSFSGRLTIAVGTQNNKITLTSVSGYPYITTVDIYKLNH